MPFTEKASCPAFSPEASLTESVKLPEAPVRSTAVRSKFGTIERQEVDAEAKGAYIRNFARGKKSFSFRELLTEAGSKAEIIISFLCILEMMKNGEVEARQAEVDDDIEIMVKDITDGDQ